MKARILTGVVGVPVLLGFIFLGGLPFAFLVGFLIVVGTYEFARMAEQSDFQFLFISVLLGQMAMLLTMYLGWKSWASMGFMVAFLLIFIQAIIHYPQITMASIGINFLGLLYTGWTLPHLIAIESRPDGTLLLFYLFVAIWSSDSGAYFIGRLLGRHKLAPHISPNKTIEGALGGIVTSVIFLLILNVFIGLFTNLEVIGVAIILSIVGQLGDLVESLLKRFMGVKDSGNLLPGHGGILDRFDSLILVAPFLYYFILLLQIFGYQM